MLKLFKNLKKYSLHILLIIALLYIQAVSDLSLPDYMSRIVNVGIQQGGIENSAPKAIREGEYEKLKLLLNDDENKLFLDNYKLLSKSNKDHERYGKKYPILDNENVFVLDAKGINKAEIKESLGSLSDFLGKKLLVLFALENDQNFQIPKEQNIFPPGTDPFQILSKLPKEQIDLMLKGIEEKFDTMPKSMITQSSILYIQAEYEAIGINNENIQRDYILKIGMFMLGIALIGLVATISVGFLSARVAANLGRILREKVFQQVTNFSSAEFDSFSTASLITRSTNDIQQIQMLMVMLLRMIFYAPIVGVGGVIKALSTNTSMAWIIAIGVLAILTLVVALFSVALPNFKKVQKLVDNVNLVIRESLVGMLVIRAFNTEKFQEKKFKKTNRELTNTNLFINRLMTLMSPMMMLIMNGLTILIIWVGAKQVDLGNIQVGDMMAFMQYTMQIIMSFLMISMVSIMYPRAAVSGQRVVEVLDKDIAIKDSSNPKSFTDNGKKGEKTVSKGLIQFKDVCFKYPGADECVISDINFTANPGETTAIIGSTGSGKSTIINLIPRFYDVTQGEILIDGINIKDVKQKELRSKIGYVPQKGILFSGTIESNIKYGRLEMTDQEMEKAVQIAQAQGFINDKEESYQSLIAQGGTNVSGGQKQRLSIARALAIKPQIFIFDDSFSALDFKTDAALRKALKEEIIESTVIIVAQRISTIINAEKILVIDEGIIVGQGTHKELLSSCKVYQEIAFSQFSEEELA